MEDTTNKEAELSHFNIAVAELEKKVSEADSNLQATIETEGKILEKIAETQTEIEEVQGIIIRESRRLDAKQNEYNLTKSMVENLEGFPESIRFLKKNTSWAKNAPLFSDVLYCKEEYRVAIENYLEPLMNHYVVESYNEAINAINLLSNSAQGRAQFFILNNLESTQSRDIEIDIDFGVSLSEAIPALKVIEVDKKYQNICKHLLSNVFLIDDDTEQSINNTRLPDGLVLIGKSGKFNKTRFTMTGGSVGLFEGKRIGRAKNLDNLIKEVKEAEDQVQTLKNKYEVLQNNLTSLKSSLRAEEIKQKQLDLNRLNTELITVKTRQEQYQNFIENSLNRKEDIGIKIMAIDQELVSLIPLLETLKEQRQFQNDILAEKQIAFNELNEYFTVESNRYNQENIRFHQQQNKVSGLNKDLDYRLSQQESLEIRITQNTNELEKVKIAIQENLQQADHSDDDLIEMYSQREELEKATQQAEQDYYDWRGKLTITENEISMLRRKKENAETIENATKDERNNLKLELSALKERLSVEFNVNINELAENSLPEDENEQELRERTEKLKKQLDEFGAINPLAVEAYNEMNERYTFIQAQKKDLSDAKASLLATIQEIDDTAREKFMSSFVLVRENFIKVFRSLFNEEDSCDLILSDPQNPLESDIDIIAKPKGKRPLSINQLSGGEKTLTATAILFSLYLLKPAPFCIFDEVDAPLDDTNIDKFNKIIRDFSTESQFIVISHNKRTIASTDIIYGVTMVEQGISRVVPVDLRELVD